MNINIFDLCGKKKEVYGIVASNKSIDLVKNKEDYKLHWNNPNKENEYLTTQDITKENFEERLRAGNFDNIAIYLEDDK